MAIAYQSSTNFTAGNATVSGISKPASTAIGDVLVAQYYGELNGGISATIASTGDTWTEIHNISNTTPNPDINFFVWYTVVANASSTITVSGDAGVPFRDFTVARFTGVDTTTPIDVTATENSGTGTTVTGTGLASGTANRWIVLATCNFDGVTSASWTSPLTERNDSENVAMAAGADTAGTDTANKTATVTSTDWCSVMFALREEGAGFAQVARPDGDVTVGNWTTDTGATTDLYAAIDETSASDSDYIRSPVAPSSEACEVDLSAPLDPLSSANHIVRVRGLVDSSGGGAMTLTTELRQFGDSLSTAATWDDTLTTSAQTFEHTLTSGQADAITDYSALRYRFTATQATPATPTLNAAGTAAFTATNGATIAPGLPASFAADDIHIMIAHRSDNTAMTSLSGWTQLLASNNTAAQRVEVWWRRAVGGDTAPTVTFGSGTVVRGARIIGIRGCRTSTDPFDTGAGAPTLLANAAAATVSFTDLTTQGANRFLLALGAYEDDPTTVTTMTNWTQPAGAVSTSALGNDMMLFYEHRALASAGSSGTAAVTVSGGTFANSVNVGIVIALLGENAQRARVTWAEFQTPQAAVAQDAPERHGPSGLFAARQIRQLLAT